MTGKPILYAGMGEKLSDLEQFHPDRMASRILGMGDVLTLIEKAEAEIDEEKAKEMSKKLKKAQFDFEDYLESMQQMKKMGGLGSIMSMMPGLGGMGPMGGMGKKGISEEQTAQARAEHGPDGSHDLLHDHRGAQKPGSSEPVQKASDRQRRRGGHQRSQPDGEAVCRDEEDDENVGQRRQAKEIRHALLANGYTARIFRAFYIIKPRKIYGGETKWQ